ncbi:MAG: cyclic nucleotide-binding domain-containing protein [Bdellovibrionales bacterium]|jgi:CRP-like cAMP-binding protein|nr:cyclic nucleotide-binding domain-containing protein [Bdellovibrionales bacterium]
MSNSKTLKSGDFLFREGDSSEAMYVIKSGKVAILKSKGSSDITLAELGRGDMVGEMAFFDGRPRSASAQATVETIVIELPFKALNAQFKSFPEWVKAIMRTVNNHLRNANMKIRSLEKAEEENAVLLPPHTVTRLCAILAMVAKVYGEKTEAGTVVPAGTLRRYTIQIHQQPTAKMQVFLDVLKSLSLMNIEDLGEGRQRLTVFKPDLLLEFVDFYNDYLFKSEDKRIEIVEKEMPALRALVFYANKAGGASAANDKGEIRVDLTQMQNESMKDLGRLFSVDDVNSLSEKKLVGEKVSTDTGLALSFNYADLEKQVPYWEIIHACRKLTRNP